MSANTIRIDELLEEASRYNEPVGPKHLLSSTSKMANPFQYSSEQERDDLHSAYQADFGRVSKYRWLTPPLENADKLIWIDLLAWLLSSLRKSKDARPSPSSLMAMLRTAAVFNDFGSVWEIISEDHYTTNLVDSASTIIDVMQYIPSARNNAKEPLWEREAVDNFLEADRAGNWAVIENSWRTIVPAIVPNEIVSEVVACLSARDLGRKVLANALDKKDNILSIIPIANSMTADQLASVAAHSNSNRARFGLVQTLAFNQLRNQALEDDVIRDLVSTFQTIQEDHAEWVKWMRALNRYPVRTASLQTAMGTSLVGSSSDAKAAYINAISLSTSFGGCREAVSTCFDTFRKRAKLADRKSMWLLSYQRWCVWDFEKEDNKASLTTSAVCDLDYAVIGYLTECLSTTEFSDVLNAACDEVSCCQTKWHRDEIDFNDAWYRALSRWQITIYADKVRKGEQPWELPSKIFLPFDREKDRYAAMSLGTRMPLNL